MKNKDLIAKINSRPLLIGQTLMFFIVKKKDEKLIDYFVREGADKGKTLMYVAHSKDYELFQKYYVRFQSELSEDEYFLVLRKTAQINFTDGYRLLVNAKRFEDLNPAYKEDVARLQHNNADKTRAPASVPK